jgi:hypothetical protein
MDAIQQTLLEGADRPIEKDEIVMLTLAADRVLYRLDLDEKTHLTVPNALGLHPPVWNPDLNYITRFH